MKTRIVLATVLFLAVAACCRAAGDETLSVRLVNCSNSGAGSEDGLEDVIELLRKGLAYKNYSLIDSRSLVLPADGSLALGGYTVVCKGGRDKLAIRVERGRKRQLETSVTLRAGKPLIVGGFPSGDGRMVLVFLVHSS